MAEPMTERRNQLSDGIDTWPVSRILSFMNSEDTQIAGRVSARLNEIERSVHWVVASLSVGRRVFYVGSGTSGRLAVVDASELPPTFGDLGQMVIPLISGGPEAIFSADEGAEDSEANGARDLQVHGVRDGDTVIGVTSSGRTPYVVGTLKAAKSAGAKTVAIVGDDSGPAAANADLTIFVDVGPEVIAGSTRLKNGTAQKLVLNMISTSAMIVLGRTYSNYMAGTSPRNTKLTGRAVSILASIAATSPDDAADALNRSSGALDVALVTLCTGLSPDAAKASLLKHGSAIRKTIEGHVKSTETPPQTRSERRLRPATPDEVGLDADKVESAFRIVQEAVGDGEGALPGAVAAIVKGDRIVGPRSFGWACRTPRRVPMSPDTLFDMASLTKVVATTPSILILCERGYFRLDDALARFIPEFGQNGKEDITIRHLLTHTSGLPDHIRFWELGLLGDAIIDYICGLPLDPASVGLRVVYSDLGFIMLGELVRRLTGQDISRFSSKEVFERLAMADTGYRPDRKTLSDFAATEYRADLGRVMWGEVHDENALALGGVAGHAGLFSSVWDVARYAAMWLGEGFLDGARILSPATSRRAIEEHTTSGERRGLGWALKTSTFSSGGDLVSCRAFGHTGFTGTSLWCDPKAGIGIVLLTNRVHAGRESNAPIRLRPVFANAVMASVTGGDAK